jgi:hypothetical protein
MLNKSLHPSLKRSFTNILLSGIVLFTLSQELSVSAANPGADPRPNVTQQTQTAQTNSEVRSLASDIRRMYERAIRAIVARLSPGTRP